MIRSSLFTLAYFSNEKTVPQRTKCARLINNPLMIWIVNMHTKKGFTHDTKHFKIRQQIYEITVMLVSSSSIDIVHKQSPLDCHLNFWRCALADISWFLPKASFGLRVLSSPASVGLCVRVCVYQSRACPHDNSSPIQARITKFGPEMQNTLVWVPIVLGDDRPWSSRSNLTWKSNFTPFWACSHHYSSAIQARITKLGPKMHLSTVNIPTNFGLDWFWSSLSFSILKPIFLPNRFVPFLYIFSETRRL